MWPKYDTECSRPVMEKTPQSKKKIKIEVIAGMVLMKTKDRMKRKHIEKTKRKIKMGFDNKIEGPNVKILKISGVAAPRTKTVGTPSKDFKIAVRYSKPKIAPDEPMRM